MNGKKYVPPEIDVSYIDECLRAGEQFYEPDIPDQLEPETQEEGSIENPVQPIELEITFEGNDLDLSQVVPRNEIPSTVVTLAGTVENMRRESERMMRENLDNPEEVPSAVAPSYHAIEFVGRGEAEWMLPEPLRLLDLPEDFWSNAPYSGSGSDCIEGGCP